VTDLARLRGKLCGRRREEGSAEERKDASSLSSQGSEERESGDIDSLNINSVHDREMVREKLQRNDVDQSLKAVDGLGHSDESVVGRESIVVVVADHDYKGR